MIRHNGNGKTNVVVSDDLLPESILKSMDTRFCQTESKIEHLEQNMHDSLSGMMKDISNLKDRLSMSNSGDKYMVALQNENEKLKKKNEFLVERLNNALFAASDLNTRVKELEKEKSCLVTAIKLVQSSDKLPSDDCETSKALNSNDAELVQADQNNVVQHSKPETITLSDDESFHHIRPLKRKYKSKKAKNRSKSKTQQDSSTVKQSAHVTADYQNDSVIINHDVSCKLESDPNFKSPSNREKKVTVIAGDSIIKNIQGWRLSTPPNHVVVKSFAGATSTDMEDYLRLIIRKEPNKVILHVGTNDISHQPASRVAQGIANLGTQIVQDSPATSIVISSILPRRDKPELSKKVIEANKLLKAFCDQNNWEFMNHTTTIDSSSLNMRGLHLNRKGTTTIASNISNCIHNS